MYRSMPAYQKMPALGKFTKAQTRLKMLISLALYFVRLDRQRLIKLRATRRMKGKYSGHVLLLGNGPSCSNITLAQVENFKSFGGKVGVMNNFLLGNHIPLSYVDFYFLMDPDYWDPILDAESTLVRRLASELESKKLELELVQPVGIPDVLTYHKISYVEGHTVAGLFRWERPTIPFGYPNSVALRAISYLKYVGFSKIFFAGLDSDLYKYYFVDDLNALFTNSEKSHFNSEEIQNQNGSSFHSLEGKEISNIVDMLYSNAVFMRDLRVLLGESGINVGLDRSNDVAPRACLIDFRP